MDREDLLQPTLTDRLPYGDRPWRLSSQVYVGFFGGPLAVGAIATLNSWLLLMPRKAMAAIVATSLAVEAFLVAIVATQNLSSGTRIASTAAGLVAYGALYFVQRSADRVYHFHAERAEPYAGLFWPGLTAVIIARIVEAILFLGAVE